MPFQQAHWTSYHKRYDVDWSELCKICLAFFLSRSNVLIALAFIQFIRLRMQPQAFCWCKTGAVNWQEFCWCPRDSGSDNTMVKHSGFWLFRYNISMERPPLVRSGGFKLFSGVATIDEYRLSGHPPSFRNHKANIRHNILNVSQTGIWKIW